jgi:hypothetical protein
MHTQKTEKLQSLISGRTIAAAVIVLLLGSCSRSVFAQQAAARSFATAGDAGQALYAAVKTRDDAAVRAILGAGPGLTSSANQSEDELNRIQFAKKYEQMHRLVIEPDGTTALYIGAENWPFPIPLTKIRGQWRFDSDAGSQEVMARQIGRNEMEAIQICQAFANGRDPEAGEATDNTVRQFAADLRNMIDNADPLLFHGYYFRVPPKKSKSVALVAYPAEYRSSGVITFLVTPDGFLYESDLGFQTAKMAKAVQVKPAADWRLVQ